MPSSHLNHQVRWWCGVQNGQNLIWLYKENIFHEQWHLISWQRMKDTMSPHKIWRPFWIAGLLFLHPNMCRFQYICRVLCSSSDTKLWWSIGRTNCLHYSTRVDQYCHQILLLKRLHYELKKTVTMERVWSACSHLWYNFPNLKLQRHLSIFSCRKT